MQSECPCAGSPACKHFAGGKILKSAEFTSDDLSQMRGPRGTRSAPWGKAIAEAKALAEEEK